MSLIGFHRFLISTAILFCAGFAAWEFRAFTTDGTAGTLALGLGSALAAAAFAYYLINLERILYGGPSR